MELYRLECIEYMIYRSSYINAYKALHILKFAVKEVKIPFFSETLQV